jgi:uncharacterized protein YlxW (UPF0749 family)
MSDEHLATGTGWPEPAGPAAPPPEDPATEPTEGAAPGPAVMSEALPGGVGIEDDRVGPDEAEPDVVEPDFDEAEWDAAGFEEAAGARVADLDTEGTTEPDAEPTGDAAAREVPAGGAAARDRDTTRPLPGPRTPTRGRPGTALSAGARTPAPGSGDRRRRIRVSGAGAVIGILLGMLGFALVVQLRSNATDTQLSSARPEDLVRIMSDLDARKDRLREEIASLQATKQQLAAGTAGRQAALAEAGRRADELGILAGTLAAQGPGIAIEFHPGAPGLKAAVLLDTVEELRGAGAEAMEIQGRNNTSVRVVASTYFLDQNTPSGPGLLVDGQTLTAPYTILAIGDPQTMQTALSIPGGVVDTVNQANGTVIVNRPGTVRVTALHQVAAPRYAHPVN